MPAAAQSRPESAREAPNLEGAPTSDNLAHKEASLKERYDRLELLAGRLAELSRGAQPRRAALLRDLITRGRERDVTGQFDRVVNALAQEKYSTAIDGQTALQADLEKLLELLLEEDRDKEIASQRKRIARYLQDLNRLIRLERGVKARTEGGDDAQELADDQQRVVEETEKLSKTIKETEGVGKPESANGDAQAKPSQSGDSQKSNDGKNSGGDPQNQQPGNQSPSPAQPGVPSQPGNSTPGGSPQSPPQDSQSPMEKAAKRLERAQQKMQQAQAQLEKAKRSGAADEQQRAVEQLERAKAELERILRQLREEEMERMLVLLEARFRKMLDAQVEVYDETKRLDAATDALPAHELEIASGRQSRKERVIVSEADRALVLLREDGTSEAFPEAIEQARDDMQLIAERLGDTKVDKITQRLEQDVIAALEETLAMLQQAIEKLRDQRARQQSGSGAPGEQPLVDRLAELRMIRALQLRVNRRTKEYGDEIEGEQALKKDLLEALERLAIRQAKILRATRDLNTKEN